MLIVKRDEGAPMSGVCVYTREEELTRNKRGKEKEKRSPILFLSSSSSSRSPLEMIVCVIYRCQIEPVVKSHLMCC